MDNNTNDKERGLIILVGSAHEGSAVMHAMIEAGMEDAHIIQVDSIKEVKEVKEVNELVYPSQTPRIPPMTIKSYGHLEQIPEPIQLRGFGFTKHDRREQCKKGWRNNKRR